MNLKQKLPRTEAPVQTGSSQKSKLVRLEDLAPKRDLRAGRRVVFGQVQAEAKTTNR